MSDLAINPIIPAFSGMADFGNVPNAQGVIGLLFDLLDGIDTVKGLVDFLQGGTPGLNEEEVDGDELNEQPAFEKEVELPAASGDADRNDVLRQRQADVGGQALHEQAICADLEAENLERVGDVEGDPNSTDQP
jgi:hypothetical protein